MAANNEEHEGASRKEILIEACRRNNVELMEEVINDMDDEAEVARLLNETKTVMGNHLYHEAASRGNYEIIDFLLDQGGFECDPINRVEGDTPLHTAIRWLNGEPPAQRDFGRALVDMMLEAGSSTRIKNKGGLTPVQLVDPTNRELKDLIMAHEYAAMNVGDFVVRGGGGGPGEAKTAPGVSGTAVDKGTVVESEGDDQFDPDAEFSGSDDDERAEWERRRRNALKGGK